MKRSSMQPANPAQRADQPRTFTRAQHAIQKEFCNAYGFALDQIGFDGKSEDPIFDFDALTALSIKLCRIPELSVELGTVDRLQGLAQSRVITVLPGGEIRKTFATALLGEEMPDGERIEDLSQAISISRARALRIGLRSVGFDPVVAHRKFVETGAVMELTPIDPYLKELAEIHLHAQSLDLISVSGDGFVNRVPYQQRMAKHFNGKTSAKDLTDAERSQWLQMLRSWSKARRVVHNRQAGARAV